MIYADFESTLKLVEDDKTKNTDKRQKTSILTSFLIEISLYFKLSDLSRKTKFSG